MKTREKLWWLLHLFGCPAGLIRRDERAWNPCHPAYITPRSWCIKCGRRFYFGNIYPDAPFTEEYYQALERSLDFSAKAPLPKPAPPAPAKNATQRESESDEERAMKRGTILISPDFLEKELGLEKDGIESCEWNPRLRCLKVFYRGEPGLEPLKETWHVWKSPSDVGRGERRALDLSR